MNNAAGNEQWYGYVCGATRVAEIVILGVILVNSCTTRLVTVVLERL